MRLADLLTETSLDDLDRLAHEHARAEEHLPRPDLLQTIEGVLRSHRFLQEYFLNRQPPTFSILVLLLDSEDYSLPAAGFRDAVLAETDRLCQAVEKGELLDRDDQLRVYRRVLYQARSNDMVIDVSEASILGVLRQELEIAQVEHFLLEHHPDLREFWRQNEAFARELHALRSAGIVYVREGKTLLPEDLVRSIRQVLGIDMSRPSARRLYGYLTHHDLHEALAAVRAPTSGSKEEKIDRLVARMVQPRVVLRVRGIGLERLREVCKEIGAAVSGSKDEVVDRILAHVAAGRDILREPEPAPPIQDDRSLSEERFRLLFSRLRGHELATILAQFDLRRWGTKEQQIRTLWDSHRAETTLLNALSSTDLEVLLKRLDLKTRGSKLERAQRAIEYFASASEEALRTVSAAISSPDNSGDGGTP